MLKELSISSYKLSHDLKSSYELYFIPKQIVKTFPQVFIYRSQLEEVSLTYVLIYSIHVCMWHAISSTYACLLSSAICS